MHEGHEHEHEHMHEHTYQHSHPHTHEAGHEHEHEHAHVHSHETGAVRDENTALLGYMLDHNEHHAKELEELAVSLREAGKTAAADMIDKAVADFNAGNEKLAKALESIKED